MNSTASEFDGSVLAIMRADTKELLGTGFAISPNLVLTCAHLFSEREISQAGFTRLPSNIIALLGDTILRSSRIYGSQIDLCCMQFPQILGAVPILLARAARLQQTAVTAVGFTRDQSAPRRHIAHKLKVIHELNPDGKQWLQFGQVHGGMPQGFSGGPVLAKTIDGWRALGMLQLGRENSATSRFIGVDPIASFLQQHGLQVAIGEFLPEPQTASSSEVNHGPVQITHIGNVNRSEVNVNQTQTVRTGKER